MVRRKVEIKPIEDKAKRHTTFTKRRQGLFKKTDDMCRLCDAEAAVITFSKAGNVYAWGHPAVDIILDRYSEIPPPPLPSVKNEDNVVVEIVNVGDGLFVEEKLLPPETEVELRASEALGKGKSAWHVALVNSELSELNELDEMVKKVKSNVSHYAREVAMKKGIRDLNMDIY